MQYRSEVPGTGSPTEATEETQKVLLVDDSNELLSVIKKILELDGYQVTAVDRVAKAFAHLTEELPDIIICDVMIPDKTGFEFHYEVRQNPQWCDIPFVFLTALSSQEEVRLGREVGCDEYLTKPFDPADLVAVVKGKLTLAKHRRKMSGIRMEGFRRRIIHTLSHEFRTPLVSVNTGAELLLDQHDKLDRDQVGRLLESVWRGGQRLERLVDDFMLLQQIDLGHALHTCELYRQRTPLRSLIETAIECFSDSLLDGDLVKVEIAPPPQDRLDELYAVVYDVQVVNVIQRLLSNAHKFGGAEQPITISFYDERDEVFIKVRDYGPGIENRGQALEHAYQPFSQINREMNEQQGCGLGLTIARYFTRINNGSLELQEPPEGPGLEAVLSFPKAR